MAVILIVAVTVMGVALRRVLARQRTMMAAFGGVMNDLHEEHTVPTFVDASDTVSSDSPPPSSPIVQLSPVAYSTPSRPPPRSRRTADEIMMEEAVVFLAR